MTSWIVTASLLLASLGQQPVPDAQEVLGLLSAGRAELNTLEANFTQITMTAEDDFTSQGTLVYAKPKRIIFRYAEPPIAYMLDRDHVYEFDAELEQVLIFNIKGRSEAEAFFLGFESDIQRIQQGYVVRALAPENPERDAVALELIPKPIEDETAIFEKVTLQLRKVDYLPTQIDIINDESSNVRFSITDFKRNIPLAKERSHIFVPELTDVVLDDEVLEVVGESGAYFPDDEGLGLYQAEEQADVHEEALDDADE